MLMAEPTNLGFSILLEDTSTCRKPGIRTSNVLITGRHALPPDIRPATVQIHLNILWHIQVWTHQWFAETLPAGILSWRPGLFGPVNIFLLFHCNYIKAFNDLNKSKLLNTSTLTQKSPTFSHPWSPFPFSLPAPCVKCPPRLARNVFESSERGGGRGGYKKL